jgi:hypothetical protein
MSVFFARYLIDLRNDIIYRVGMSFLIATYLLKFSQSSYVTEFMLRNKTTCLFDELHRFLNQVDLSRIKRQTFSMHNVAF